jgi:hypothetical protein
MSVGPPVVTDIPKGSEQRAGANGAYDGAVNQDGPRLSMRLYRLCDVQQVDTFERTTVREHQNDAPQNEWWAGVGGAMFLGAGIAAVASPDTMQPTDGSRSSKEVRGAGYAAIGVGALLLAVPIIDYVRAHEIAEQKVERTEVAGPMVQRDVRCGPAPAGMAVSARLRDGRNLQVGRTDARGALDARLDDIVPRDERLAATDSAMLQVDDRDVGAVALGPLYERREAEAWRLAESSQCRDSLDAAACNAEVAYLKSYPSGGHATDAERAILAATSRRRIAAETDAWARLDLKGCRTPATNDLGALESACAPLAAYAVTFPDGAHVDAVRDALSAAQAVRARLEAAEARAATESAGTGAGEFIPYAGNGGGPTMCSDGSLSHSSGRGTCSHHGGIAGGSGRSYRSSSGRRGGRR